MRKVALISVVVMVAFLAACASPAKTPDEGEQVVSAQRVEIQVNTVEVQQVAYDPAQVEVAVEGIVGDSCNTLAGSRQEREGNAITVTIEAIRTLGVICQELAQLYDDTIRLEGDFPPGNYTVIVNGVSQEFTVVSLLEEAEKAARAALAADLGIDPAEPRLISIEEVLWGDASLGCPEPGMAYIQMIVPGYRLVFEHAGQRYEYHTDQEGSRAVTCY